MSHIPAYFINALKMDKPSFHLSLFFIAGMKQEKILKSLKMLQKLSKSSLMLFEKESLI